MKNIPISAMIGLFFTALYFLMAIFAPLLAPYGMAEIVGDVWEPRSAEHLLGTDNIGRDLLSRIDYEGKNGKRIEPDPDIVMPFDDKLIEKGKLSK